jgi:hypothetical protein
MLYGPIRLPLLYLNFRIVEVLYSGMDEMLVMAGKRGDSSAQPFVVLQNKIGCKQSE